MDQFWQNKFQKKVIFRYLIQIYLGKRELVELWDTNQKTYPFLLCKELNVLQIECKRPEKMIDLMHENRHSYKRCSNQLPEYKLYPVPDHCWSVSLLESKVLETLVLTRPNLQCCLIENHQSPFYVVNRVTLTGKKAKSKILIVL